MATKQKLKNSELHQVPQTGLTLIQKLEIKMDGRRKWLENAVIKHGAEFLKSEEYILNRGRYEGLASAIALLRTGATPSTIDIEIGRSNERLGIE